MTMRVLLPLTRRPCSQGGPSTSKLVTDFVRELVQEKKLRTTHIPGEDNLADIFY